MVLEGTVRPELDQIAMISVGDDLGPNKGLRPWRRGLRIDCVWLDRRQLLPWDYFRIARDSRAIPNVTSSRLTSACFRLGRQTRRAGDEIDVGP